MPCSKTDGLHRPSNIHLNTGAPPSVGMWVDCCCNSGFRHGRVTKKRKSQRRVVNCRVQRSNMSFGKES
ncbi:hypothetical protein PEX1_018170 [Penicillium expansum]|uniref:Uncharacterized protein n=1 Tax=Penicillium expansum TaxID=27334 RepID=A0A0A2K296_PENEN|nr:hypothetical protein PEX2_044580 [Penicillium expansum]KGO47332.1 hypothetical protein PEXP_081310 [Penicillium expansum]KGO61028.1 hypothetical protein PEX1_018170 [Penicillium expansum]KGO62935.1 hypothetical protein PEX2_044580 [Penicillium expansum]